MVLRFLSWKKIPSRETRKKAVIASIAKFRFTQNQLQYSFSLCICLQNTWRWILGNEEMCETPFRRVSSPQKNLLIVVWASLMLRLIYGNRNIVWRKFILTHPLTQLLKTVIKKIVQSMCTPWGNIIYFKIKLQTTIFLQMFLWKIFDFQLLPHLWFLRAK